MRDVPTDTGGSPVSDTCIPVEEETTGGESVVSTTQTRLFNKGMKDDFLTDLRKVMTVVSHHLHHKLCRDNANQFFVGS